MDERVTLLMEELMTHPKDQGLDFDRWRERFQTVFAQKIDEASRVALLDAYKSFLDLFERNIKDAGGDVEGFQNARATDWRVLCIQEAQLALGREHFHPAVLGAIVGRELAAGRMQNSDFTELAMTGAQTFQEKKKGLLSRLFGK